MKLVSLKMPEEMFEQFEHAAQARSVSRSLVLREALAEYLARLNLVQDLSVADLAGDLIGSLKGGTPDLSTNPAYMVDYGK